METLQKLLGGIQIDDTKEFEDDHLKSASEIKLDNLYKAKDLLNLIRARI